MTASIEVAKMLAEIFGVTVDYLVSDEKMRNILQDQTMLERWREIDELAPPEQERILSVVDSLVRDAEARQADRMSA
jgi:hypothetical protein